jgi:hypothetical protein
MLFKVPGYGKRTGRIENTTHDQSTANYDGIVSGPPALFTKNISHPETSPPESVFRKSLRNF